MGGTRASRYVGWLLRVNRRLAEDATVRSGREFARLFRADRPLSPSHVTRWENGELRVSRGTIRRYEQLLRLPAESLVTISDAMLRSVGTVGVAPLDGVVTARSRARLHELLYRATGTAEMSGADWSELTELISARPELELHPPSLWGKVVDRLLSELVVAVDSSWLQRQEAMCRLLEHPSAGRHAVVACIALADDSASPAVVEPLSLLNVADDPYANRYVLRQLDQPTDDRAMLGALLAAADKVRQGHFRDEEATGLIRGIRNALGEPHLNSDLLALVIDVASDLARRMPEAASFGRALCAPHVVDHLRTAAPTAVTRAVSRRIADQAQAELTHEISERDDILTALVAETVFASNADRRLVATMLIAATPYRIPVARALLGEVTQDFVRRTQIFPLASALRTLTQLNVDIHRPLVHRILAMPGSDAASRYAAAWAVPHCPGRFPVPVWREILSAQHLAWTRSPTSGDDILQAVVYGIGTDNHRDLLAEIRNSPHLPGRARTMASWLLHANQPLP